MIVEPESTARKPGISRRVVLIAGSLIVGVCVVGVLAFNVGAALLSPAPAATQVVALATRVVTRTPTPTSTPELSPTPIAPNVSVIRFAPAVLQTDKSAVDPQDRYPSGMSLLYAVFSYSG